MTHLSCEGHTLGAEPLDDDLPNYVTSVHTGGIALKYFAEIDIQITNWMARHGVVLLRYSLGIVFFWFGFLKFFPGVSPAENLATQTMDVLTFGQIPTHFSFFILATWECIIGLGLIVGRFMRATLLLLWLQMLGAITPLFLFPEEMFTLVPYAPTLEGQYIIKNIVLISASLVMGATVRGGRLVAAETNPELFGE